MYHVSVHLISRAVRKKASCFLHRKSPNLHNNMSHCTVGIISIHLAIVHSPRSYFIKYFRTCVKKIAWWTAQFEQLWDLWISVDVERSVEDEGKVVWNNDCVDIDLQYEAALSYSAGCLRRLTQQVQFSVKGFSLSHRISSLQLWLLH